MKKLLLFAILTIFVGNIFAQNLSSACSSKQLRQFDFWLGTWDLEWTDSKGTKQRGTNTVNKILNGCVIEENFNGGGTPQFLGKSHSVFDKTWNKWMQTWVDSEGTYINLEGEFIDGKMILSREFISRQGKKVMQKMIFSNIQKDSFEWDWLRSDDDGKTWKSTWKINYIRKNISAKSLDINRLKDSQDF